MGDSKEWASPGASRGLRLKQTYKTRQKSLSPYSSNNWPLCKPECGREGSQGALPEGARKGLRKTEDSREEERGKREWGAQRRQLRARRTRVWGRRGWGELGRPAPGPSAAADPQAPSGRARGSALLPPGPASPHCFSHRVLTTRLSRFPMVQY